MVEDKFDLLLNRLESLESRISTIEGYLRIGPVKTGQSSHPVTKNADSDQSLEFTIGEFWLAQVGAVLLMLGVAFFISYPIPGIPAIAASLLGYVAVAALMALSRYWQENYNYLSRILFGGGLLLIYFATLRLHFYSTDPLISSTFLGVLLVFMVLTIILYIAVKRKSGFVVSMVLLLFLFSGLISESPLFSLVVITITGLITVSLLFRTNWHGVATSGLFFVYCAHLLWLLNNPLVGNTLQPAPGHGFNLFFLAMYASAFAVINRFRNPEQYPLFFEILISVVNSLGIFLVGALNILFYFKEQSSILGFLTFLYFIIAAIINYKHTKGNFSAPITASFGFIALSFSIFTQFNNPDYFFWLALQSLMVIVFALWFRSRLIVVANIFIFLFIYALYLIISEPNGLINLSFALSSLASARILNWKKERLLIKTDMMRNLYLVCAFFIVLYGLFHAVPENIVSLSWMGAAIFYFVLSLLLKNIKYRWMSILTVFATVLHVIFYDMSNVASGFRIVVFLAIGLLILLFSVVYSRYNKKLSRIH